MYFDAGLLILRVVVGLLLFGHGAQKLFGWFGGYGLKGTTGWIGSMGMQPAAVWAFLAGLSEMGGGLLLAIGFLNPLGPLGIVAAMAVATIKVHWTKGIWAGNGGMELPLTNIAAALAVAFAGPGAYSLDALLGASLPEPVTLVAGLVLVAAGVVASQVQSRQPATAK